MIPTPTHPREPSMRQTQASAIRAGYSILTYRSDVGDNLHIPMLATDEVEAHNLYITEVQEVTRDGDGDVVIRYRDTTTWTYGDHAILWARAPLDLAGVPVQRVLARLPRRLDETLNVRVASPWLARLDETIVRLRDQGYDVDRSSLIRVAVDDFIAQVPQ